MTSMSDVIRHLPKRLALACAVMGLLLGVPGVPNAARAPAAARAVAHVRIPARDYSGIRVGMEREEAHERLDRIGHAQGGESEEGDEATWALSDRRYGFVTVSFDRSGHVGWYSLFARRGGQAVLMREIGDLSQARQQGNYIYVWDLPARGSRPACKVIVRSQDPDTLRSLSVSGLNPQGSARLAAPHSAR